MDEGLADEEWREENSRQSKQQWSNGTFSALKKKKVQSGCYKVEHGAGWGVVYSIARVMRGLRRVQLMRVLVSHVKDLDFSAR